MWGKKWGKFNGGAPSRGYNLVSGDSFGMKLTLDIEEKLGKTKKNVTSDKVGFTEVKRIKQLFWDQLEKAIVTKQHFSKKE